MRALAERDYEEAARSVRQESEEPGAAWTPERFEGAMAPFYAEYEELVFNHAARQAQNTRMVETGSRRWDVTQVLVDSAGDNFWFVDVEVDLSREESFDGSLLRLRRIGT